MSTNILCTEIYLQLLEALNSVYPRSSVAAINQPAFSFQSAPSVLGAVSYMSLFISKLKMNNSVTPSQMLSQATELV